MGDTTTIIRIYSRRMDQTYDVVRFTEYRVDLDLETDADEFNMVFANPDGAYTGLFNKFDPVVVYINKKPVMKGLIDEVEYHGDENGDVIQIVGRDIAAVLIDNDALPTTKHNVNPAKYIESKCKEYGIKKYKLDKKVPVQKKLIIGTGETEISIMQNLVVESNRRLWTIYDTLYMGKWDYKASPSYYFTRGLPMDKTGIPIKSFSLRDNGADIKSEVKIYGSTNDGKDKVTGTAKNSYMIKEGIKKRKVLRSYNNDASSKYSSNALEKIRDDFRSGIELRLTVKTHTPILMNRTAKVVDANTRLNSTFFIKGVRYQKSINGGSTTEVIMIPGDTTFNVIWNNQSNKTKGNITGLGSQSLADLLKSGK